MKFIRSDDKLVYILLCRNPGIILVLSHSPRFFFRKRERGITFHIGPIGMYFTSDHIIPD